MSATQRLLAQATRGAVVGVWVDNEPVNALLVGLVMKLVGVGAEMMR